MHVIEENIFATNLDRNSKTRNEYLKERETEFFGKNLMEYGFDYFDNKDNGYAYKGYNYDGRYKKTAERFCKLFNIRKKSKLLEIGCAKGFFLREFLNLGIDVYGLDYSEYAVNNCHPDLVGRICQGDCSIKENYPDIKPDYIISKETLPHLEKKDVLKSLEIMNNIVKDSTNIIIQIQCIEDLSEKINIMKFDPTHKTLQTKEDWIKDLKNANYNGYVCFKRLFINESKPL